MRGRDEELDVALSMLRAAEAGRGGVLLVEGEPGIGKSRFLEESATTATARGFTLAWGQTEESAWRMPGSRVLPPAPAEWLISTPQNEGRPGRACPSGPPPAGRPAHGPALRTAEGQMLVVLDDLQCADRAMLWGLLGLTQHPRARSPVWILARNTADSYSNARWLFSHLERAGAARIRLGPLGEPAVADVVTEILGAVPDEGLLDLAAGAGGNPLLLTELIAGLRDEGKIRADAGSARLASGQLPQRLLAVVQCWVAALGPRVRQVLTVGAVLGRSFSLDDVAVLLRETPARLLPEVEAALGADLVAATSDTLTFGRELVWRVLAESVPGPARQALHRQIGQLLLDQGGSVTEAASHLVSAGRPCPPAALARLDRATRSFLAAAPQTAADLALQALSLSERTDQDFCARMATAVEALTAAGRLAEAEECAQAALAGPGPVPRPAALRLRSLLSSVRLSSGRAAEAISLARDLLTEPGLCAEARDEAEITRMLGWCASAEDLEWVRARADAILGGPGPGRDQRPEPGPRLAAALLVRAVFSWREGRLTLALDLAREAARVASAATAAGALGPAPLQLGTMLVSLGELDQAEKVIRALQAAARATGPGGRDASTEILAAGLALADGRPGEAVAGAERGLELAAAQGSRLLSRYGLAILAASALRAGDLTTAAQHVRSGQDRLARDALGCGYGQIRSLVVAAQVAEVRQDTDGAAALASSLHAHLLHRPSALLDDLTAPGWLVRFALGRGNRKHAEVACAAAGELAAGNPGFAGIAAAAAHARGLLDHDDDALRRAAEGGPDPWARASAAEDLGGLLIGRHDFVEAGRRLEDSLAGYDQAAALRDGRRVRRRLRGIGIRRRHFTHATRPKSGWMSLTDTERAVSDLVAKGLTNQQIAAEMFLSTHTVAFHLRQVFRKLDIGSRVDLARVCTEQAQRAKAPTGSVRPGKGRTW